jgi:hypothetical protein
VGWDLYGAEFCLVREGVLEAVYQPGKLLVSPHYNRTDVNVVEYPPSHVEMAIELVLAFVNTFDYNATQFTKGMLAEFILGVSGDVHPDSIDAFIDLFREATQGVRRAHQPPIMPLPSDGDLKKIDLKANNRDMMFEVWMSVLVALCTAVYRMDPSTVNSKPWEGGSGPSLNAPNREKEISLAKEEGLQGDLNHLAKGILNPIVQSIHPDLMVMWEFGDFDPQREAEINGKRAQTSITRNEVRLAEGLKPKGYWVPDDQYDGLSDEDKDRYDSNLWNMPTDPTFVNAVQQAQMMEQGGPEEMGGPPGMGGPGQEEEDDGYGGPPGGPQGQEPDDDGYGQRQAQFPFGQRPDTGGQLRKGSRDREITVYVERIPGGS